MRAEMVMLRGKVYHVGWFQAWSLRYAKWNLDSKQLFYADRVVLAGKGGEKI